MCLLHMGSISRNGATVCLKFTRGRTKIKLFIFHLKLGRYMPQGTLYSMRFLLSKYLSLEYYIKMLVYITNEIREKSEQNTCESVHAFAKHFKVDELLTFLPTQ